MSYCYCDNEEWIKHLKKINIIADCVDVYWDSKSFSPRLQNSKKRGSEALKEFKRHFLAMKDKGVEEKHIDLFVDIVRAWRLVKRGKERTYNADWLNIMWGKYLKMPTELNMGVNLAVKKRLDMDILMIKGENIPTPTAYNIKIGDNQITEPQNICSDVPDSGEIDYCGSFETLTQPHKTYVAPPDPNKIEAITLLIKTLDLSKSEILQLIHSSLSLL